MPNKKVMTLKQAFRKTIVTFDHILFRDDFIMIVFKQKNQYFNTKRF